MEDNIQKNLNVEDYVDGNEMAFLSYLFIYLFIYLFWPCSGHVYVPGPRNPPRSSDNASWLLNQLSHKGTPRWHFK